MYFKLIDTQPSCTSSQVGVKASGICRKSQFKSLTYHSCYTTLGTNSFLAIDDTNDGCFVICFVALC
jgi:hypothetical protein